jgi:hypothetical protein
VLPSGLSSLLCQESEAAFGKRVLRWVYSFFLEPTCSSWTWQVGVPSLPLAGEEATKTAPRGRHGDDNLFSHFRLDRFGNRCDRLIWECSRLTCDNVRRDLAGHQTLPNEKVTTRVMSSVSYHVIGAPRAQWSSSAPFPNGVLSHGACTKIPASVMLMEGAQM